MPVWPAGVCWYWRIHLKDSFIKGALCILNHHPIGVKPHSDCQVASRCQWKSRPDVSEIAYECQYDRVRLSVESHRIVSRVASKGQLAPRLSWGVVETTLPPGWRRRPRQRLMLSGRERRPLTGIFLQPLSRSRPIGVVAPQWPSALEATNVPLPLTALPHTRDSGHLEPHPEVAAHTVRLGEDAL